MHRLLCSLLCLFVVGCTDPSPDEGDPTPRPTPGTAGLGLDGFSCDGSDALVVVDFGDVPAGEFRDRDLVLGNCGDQFLEVLSGTLSHEDSFQLLAPSDWPVRLGAGEEVELQLRFTPVTDASYEETLTIPTSDRILEVTLRAEGIAPRLEVDPSSHDFGDLEVGCVATRTVTLRNAGRAELVLDWIGFEDLTANGEMTMQSLIDLTQPLEPSEEVSLDVRYGPADATPGEGLLTVASNDPANPLTTASFVGTAHVLAPVTQDILQSSTDQMDILFVVDPSAAVAPRLAALANSISSMTATLDAEAVDYQVGVVSSAASAGGVLVAPTVGAGAVDPAGDIAAALQAIPPSEEACTAFDATVLALSGANVAAGGPNEGLHRPGAGLHVVYISGSVDQSGLLGGGSPGSYVTWLQGLVGPDGLLIVSAIAGGLTGCVDAGGQAFPATTDFVEASVLGGGSSDSLCGPSPASSMSLIGWLSVPQVLFFELSAVPVQATIEVSLAIDGVNFVPLTTGWIFNPARNAVTFDDASVPPPNSTVRVVYSPQSEDCD